MSLSENQTIIINNIISKLQEEGNIVMNSEEDMSVKLEKMDVLVDTMRFLKDYNENVKVLNKSLKEKKTIER